MSKQIKIEMDDVVIVTQTLASVIQRKGLHPDEFKKVRDSWDKLMDVVSKLQRNAVINKLYPETPPMMTQPDLSIPNNTVPTEPTNPTEKIQLSTNHDDNEMYGEEEE